MRIAVINLFIDINIWLAMFHLSKDDLKELNKLKELTSNIYAYLTFGIED